MQHKLVKIMEACPVEREFTSTENMLNEIGDFLYDETNWLYKLE